jgi:hypothetical protein
VKRILLAFLLSLFTAGSFAQSLYGVYGGVGIVTKYKSGITPVIGVEYLKSVMRHVYVGADLCYESYYFTRNDDEFSRFGGYGYRITHNTTYAFFTPKVDVGISHFEHLHAFFSLGPGFRVSGDQRIAVTTQPSGPAVHPGLSYDSSNISKNINHTIFRFCFGFSFRPTPFKGWDVTITPVACVIPSWLSTNSFGYSGDASMNIKSNYVALQIGLLRKRHWEPFKPRKSWGGY